MKYEITIRELVPYTAEEQLASDKHSGFVPEYERYSDKSHHVTRVLHVELTPQEFQAIKKAILGNF